MLTLSVSLPLQLRGPNGPPAHGVATGARERKPKEVGSFLEVPQEAWPHGSGVHCTYHLPHLLDSDGLFCSITMPPASRAPDFWSS